MLRGYGSSRAHRGEDHGQLARGDCAPPDQNHLEEASSMISPVFKAIDLEAEDRGTHWREAGKYLLGKIEQLHGRGCA